MYEVLYIVACESKRDLEIREEIDRDGKTESRRLHGRSMKPISLLLAFN